MINKEEVLEEYLRFLRRIPEFAKSRKIQHLKEHLIEMDMIPLGKLFDTIFQTIKTEASDKSIEIEIKGAEIKIDRGIFDLLYEPVFYILRNIVEYGIEKPEERLKNGKKQTSYIKIHVKRKGRDIVIRIKNDGRGMDPERVKQLGIQKGLIPSEHIFSSPEEILSYIFTPEFSISEEVDFLSGRGMGFDMVKRAISKIKGSVEVLSEKDKETIFTIKVPQSLTVSILLIFCSLNLNFAVPITHIEEILSVKDFPELKDERIIIHRNRVIPVKFFSEIFLPSTDEISEKAFIIVFNLFGIRKGLVVENILGYEEVFLHEFGKFLEGMNQYSGYYVSEQMPGYVIDPLTILDEGVKI